MADKITRKRILAYLHGVYKKSPWATKSTDEISSVLGISFIEAKGELIYLHQRGLVDSSVDEDNNWYQRINADGIDELEKLESESSVNTNHTLDIEVSRDNFHGIMKVFISHKFEKRNQELALILRNALRSRKIDGYLAESKREYELLIGDKIRNEIDNSDFVVGIITKESEKSASVNQELGYALGREIPIIMMVEKDVPHGVLTHGRETEEFTREQFEKHSLNVVEYILERGTKKSKSADTKWLKEHVYIPLYNKMMKINTDPDKFRSIPTNPWNELEPFAMLKAEGDVKHLFEEYSKELEQWKILLLKLQHGFTTNQHRLGEIIKTAFEKVSLIKPDGYIILEEGSSQEPKDWISAFRFIILDDSITSDEVLYKKLIDFAAASNNGHLRWLLNWKAKCPTLYTHIFNLLPQLRNELRLDFTDKHIIEQMGRVSKIVENIVTVLEDKIL